MKSPLIALVFFASVHFAEAQLGASSEKCSALFGKPLRNSGTDTAGNFVASYRTAAFQVTASFKQGAAAYLIYRRNDGASMSDQEIQGILDSHAAEKQRWVKKVITGERNPTVHAAKRLKGPFHDIQHGAREWHVLGHKEFEAAFYFEKNVLVIWNAGTGLDGATILQENRL